MNAVGGATLTHQHSVNSGTGALVNADSTPAATLVVNGTASANAVTVASGLVTGTYKLTVTLPTLVSGDNSQLFVYATVGGIITGSFVWNALSDPLRSGQAQGGTNSGITLDASASATTDIYKGCILTVTAGTGAGQSRVCTAYNGTTKAATVDWNWITNPASGSVFAIRAIEAPALNSSLKPAATIAAGDVTGPQTYDHIGAFTMTSLNVTGNTTHAGAVVLSSSLSVAGNTTFAGVTLSSLNNSGATTLAGAVSLGSSLSIAGNTTFSGTVSHAGVVSYAANISLTSLSCSGNVTFAGAVSATAGLTISNASGDAFTITSSGGNGNAMVLSGNGTGNGFKSTGGATGRGMYLIGGATSGSGLRAEAQGTGYHGFHVIGNGTGNGMEADGGATGAGMRWIGGGTSGDGLYVTTTSGNGLNITPTAGHGIVATANGTSKHGMFVTGGTAGVSDGMHLIAGFGGVKFNPISRDGTLDTMIQQFNEADDTWAVTISGNVSGDVGGKVLGGGISAITGTGARVVDASGNAVGTAASQTTILNAVNAITTNTARGRLVLPYWLVRPAAGSTSYEIDLNVYNLQGQLEAPDAAPTIHARNPAGSSLDSSLGSTTMTLIALGRYKVTFTVASTDTAQEAIFDATWAVGAVPFSVSDATEIQDAELTATTAAIKAKTDLIATNAADSPNAITAQGTISTNLNATVGSRLATTSYTAPDNTSIGTILTRTDVATSTRLATSGYTAPDNTTIATISTNLSTLMNRVGSFTGSGVNTILGFLKSAFSKTATTPSDVGGTFDPATDSLEALRDRGDLAWIGSSAADVADAVWDEAMADHLTAGTTGAKLNSGGGSGGAGTGPATVVITVNDGSAAIQGVEVHLQNGATGYDEVTDSSGNATFHTVDALTYTITAAATGYQFGSATVVVSSNAGTKTISMTPKTVTPSPDPLKCTCFVTNRDADALYRWRLTTPPPGSPGGYSTHLNEETVGAGDLLQFEAYRGGIYVYGVGNGSDVTFTVPNQGTFELPSATGEPL